MARETVGDLQVMIRVLSDHYKTRTMFERMQLLIEFITSSINPALDAEQQGGASRHVAVTAHISAPPQPSTLNPQPSSLATTVPL